MSAPETPKHTASPGEAIRIEAADWILRQRTEPWNEERQREFDGWAAQSSAHLLAYLRLEAAWKQTDRLAALRGSENPPTPRSARLPLLIRVAAVLGVFAVAGAFGAYYMRAPAARVFATPVGARERVTLADGSVIELNTDTELHIANKASARLVTLDRGEAYFQVKHDAAHPFVVVAGNRRITDLGTQFDVRRDSGALTVSLVEGRARFDARHRSLDLTPGDRIVADAQGIVKTQEPAAKLARALSWRRGVLVFYGTTLAQAAAEFNRYSTVKLVIPDPRVAALRINGTFHIDNVGAFVDATKVVLGLKLEAHDREIVISQ